MIQKDNNENVAAMTKPAWQQSIADLFQKLFQNRRPYWVRVICLALIGLAAEHLLDDERVLLHTRYTIYNVQTETLYRSKPAGLNTYFVAIDDDAFWKGELARRIPLKRNYLARLVTAVGDASPRAIVLDFDLRAPDAKGGSVPYSDYDKETNKLRESLQAVAMNHRLVLPRSVDVNANGQLAEQADIFDNLSFGNGASHVYRGYIQLPYDLRTVPLCLSLPTSHLDSLAVAMLHATYPDIYDRIEGSQGGGCGRAVDLQWGRFISPARLADRVLPAASVLAKDSTALEKISGNVVIICATWHQHSYKMGPPIDVHDSPAGDIPGAFVHENYYEALIQGHYFDSLSDILIDVIELVLIMLSAALMLLKKSLGWRLFAAFLPAIFMVFLSYLFLQNMGAFFECFTPVIVLLCHMSLDRVLEWREQARKYSLLSDAS